MKKKKMIAMLTTLVLVAVVGVGATLAYFTDRTAALTNTFNVGKNVSITLSEESTTIPNTRVIVSSADEVGSFQTYSDMLPGKFVTKDPKVKVGTNSSPCYLFLMVDGLNDLKPYFTVKTVLGSDNVVNSNWHKLTTDEGLDGMYVYWVDTEGESFGPDFETAALFDKIKINDGFVENDIPQNGFESVKINAGAYQAGEGLYDDAIAEMEGIFNSNTN